jgi:hypothetical protein
VDASWYTGAENCSKQMHGAFQNEYRCPDHTSLHILLLNLC